MLNKKSIISLTFIVFILFSCKPDTESFKIDYENYTLDNGLQVILHQDTSDPIVAITTLFHVGSNREKPGRTGFAHFFEHMSFNDSENVPRGANRKMISELGGTRNGGTWSDGTVYYEVVPKDAFEKVLWIDSDRLGYMINTVTEEALEREKQVVKNEKRERVDNTPYGHTNYVIRKNLYPEGHPYNWTVIGELEDLQEATLEDVKEFYEKYYGANNATLVIAGDIDIDETKQLVEKWFGEIRRGPEVEKLQPWIVSLNDNRSLFYEDNFAKLPELRLTFPVIQDGHPDMYALGILSELLAGTKKSPLYQVIVEEEKLAPAVYARSSLSEIAGEFIFTVRANQSVDLDNVLLALEKGLERFESEGFGDVDLQRTKAGLEYNLYSSIETVFDKAYQMAIYSTFTGDPAYYIKAADQYRKVTREDVLRVYDKYIKDRNYIATSFVPKGFPDLALADATPADIKEEVITEMAAFEEVTGGEEATYTKTPTKFERVEPPLGETPFFKSPEVWTGSTSKGIDIYGINSQELPLVTFDLTIDGGYWLNPVDKPGIVYLLTDLMMEGTRDRTPAELEETIDLLGAGIGVSYGSEEFNISGRTLSRNFEATMDLVEEILLEPRWDEKEFDRLKKELITRLIGNQSNPNSIAAVVTPRLQYGMNHILGNSSSGTIESVESITLDDLKEYYKNNIVPSLATFHIVGDVSSDRVLKKMNGFGQSWEDRNVEFPTFEIDPQGQPGTIYFVDVPGSKQSVIRVGKLTMSAADDDYNNLSYANMAIGGGSYARLFQLLRIEKGYTYGAYSFLGGTKEKSQYLAYTSVRANATRASLDLIRDLYRNYASTFSIDDVETTKNKKVKDNTRNYESMSAKLGLLKTMSRFDLESTYIEDYQDELLSMTIDDFRAIINKYLNEEDMFYLVVGDAETQLEEIRGFGIGEPVLLDNKGNPL